MRLTEPPPWWRSEPYRLFFPLGWLLAWAGVSHWLLLALGLDGAYRSIFHAMAQVQGFLTCYALGFLLTFVPRRTQTPPPSTLLVAVLVVCPILTTVFAFLSLWSWSQLPWLTVLVLMTAFAARRMAVQRPAASLPASFVWVPLALAMGFVATVVTGVAAAVGPQWMWLHDVARGAILQGTFTGLVLGVGSVLLPGLTRGEPAPSGTGLARLLHAGAALAFLGSFVLEAAGWLVMGYALRSFIAICVLVLAGRLHLPPTQPGLHRRLAWLGAWCVPTGLALVAALPGYKQAGLHVTFIGGFALLTFAVSTHVVLSHGGQGARLARAPWQLVALAAGVGVALAFRVVLVFEPSRFSLWAGLAAGAFLLAMLAWVWLVGGTLRPRRAADA